MKYSESDIVIISDSLRDWVEIPKDIKIHIFWESNVLKKALALIQNNDRREFRFFLFLLPEDVAIVDNFFNNFAQKDITYKIAVILTSAANVELTEHLDTVVTVRTGRITSEESRFLLHDGFFQCMDHVFHFIEHHSVVPDAPSLCDMVEMAGVEQVPIRLDLAFYPDRIMQVGNHHDSRCGHPHIPASNLARIFSSRTTSPFSADCSAAHMTATAMRDDSGVTMSGVSPLRIQSVK